MTLQLTPQGMTVNTVDDFFDELPEPLLTVEISGQDDDVKITYATAEYLYQQLGFLLDKTPPA